MQFVIGLVLLVFGFISVALELPFFHDIVYLVFWAGLLLSLDAINYAKYKKSLFRTRPLHTFLIIFPLSTIYWLIFEFINLHFVQWQYTATGFSPLADTLFAFLCYATVIPIIIEILWLLAGPIKLKLTLKQSIFLHRHGRLLVLLGIVFLILPFFSNIFWLNQMMWIAPLFVFAPFLAFPEEKPPSKSLSTIVLYTAISGLLAGVLWEFFNFWASSKWEYIIAPDMPRLFEMPLLGYIGFIPFAFSTVALYILARRFFRPNLFTSLVLYLLALAASYLLIFLS